MLIILVIIVNLLVLKTWGGWRVSPQTNTPPARCSYAVYEVLDGRIIIS